MIYLSSGQSTLAFFFEMNAKSSCLLVGSRKKSAQFAGSLFLPVTSLQMPFPLFSLVDYFMLLEMYVSGFFQLFYDVWNKDIIGILIKCHNVGRGEQVHHSRSIKQIHVNGIRRIALGVLGQNVQKINFPPSDNEGRNDGSHGWRMYSCHSLCSASRCTCEKTKQQHSWVRRVYPLVLSWLGLWLWATKERKGILLNRFMNGSCCDQFFAVFGILIFS